MKQSHPLAISHLCINGIAVALKNGSNHLIEKGMEGRFPVYVAIHGIGAIFD
jgi:hypothetical protein